MLGAVAGFGIGETAQTNLVSDVLESHLSLPPLASGLVMAVLVGLVLLSPVVVPMTRSYFAERADGSARSLDQARRPLQ